MSWPSINLALIKEDICGIVYCYNKPIKRCKKCKIYYCLDHFSSHLGLLPDTGDVLDYESSNEGLELFMDDNKPELRDPPWMPTQNDYYFVFLQ